MQFIKRFALIVIINLLVITTLSLTLTTLRIAGIELPEGYTGLLFIYAVIGFSGAFISLFLSKKMAKWRLGVKIIDEDTQSQEHRWLVEKVHHLAVTAGLRSVPEVGYYDSVEINAFATGSSRNNSLVAVSTGLMKAMTKDEVEGVLAHEVAHVANGDMVTMTLIQGLMNTMVLFLASLIANAVTSAGNERRSYHRGFLYFFVFQIAQVILSILGSIVVNGFSRRREFRADAGGANYAGHTKMIAALKALERQSPWTDPGQASVANLKISGRHGSWAKLFATHPSLENRIARLTEGQWT